MIHVFSVNAPTEIIHTQLTLEVDWCRPCNTLLQRHSGADNPTDLTFLQALYHDSF